MRRLTLLAAFVSFSLLSIAQTPAPYGAVPSPRQLAWHKLKYYAFVHFNMNTFTNEEWGHGTETPDMFNPTQLDCRQWAKVAKEAGMEGIVITAKHHDGFCLWPSKYTEHSVKNSKWRNGKGDVLKDLSEACKEYGLKFGVYLSPWDRNHPAYGTPEYNEVFKKTLQEVLTQYGDVFEVWFDGANGEGPNGKKQVYDWPGFIETVRKYQPNAVIFSDAGPDIRWVGNEDGYAGETNWSTLNRDKVYPAYPNYWELTLGHEDGTHWVPTEVNCSIRPGWYYHASEDNKEKSLEHLVDIYYSSIGRNGNWLLNLPVDRRGLVHENDVKQLMALKAYTDKATHNLAGGKKITSNSVFSKASTFAAGNVLDASRDTYWAAAEGAKQATLDIDLGKPTTLNRLLIEEYIALGQRVKKFSVAAWQKDGYQTIASGTTIGNRRILRFPTVTTTKIRVSIDESKASPLIRHIEMYNAPELIVTPVISRNKEGMVTIVCPKTTDPVITYTTDGSEPTAQSKRFTQAVALPQGGVIKARAFVDNMKKASSPVTAEFDISSAKWTVVSTGDAVPKKEAVRLIDGNADSFWQQRKQAESPTSVVLDLGEELPLKGFTYLPRQDGKKAGIVYRYAVSVSQDGKTWSAPVSQGAFNNINNNPVGQAVRFDKPQTARFLKFDALETTEASDATVSIAELGVLTR
ncbi:alpha-L-fucosidase [Spirosoma linguale]|uniref:alpha-L-fucosidase n=1 Tax=Spirosoma linguale (strain ATCC 33905 / DSM 74 / LMG 10896 / Claus 1) TaxID=504472 RepID=D2QHT5_SPILD|nr:coagulation factor 5/8 type domain protein [Spirosoma linguale DSM 74]